MTIVEVKTEEQIGQTQLLFAEYFEFLRVHVDTALDDLDDAPTTAGYRDEIAELPGRYAPPAGCLLLAQIESQPVGCVAFYPFADGVCEVKRLWVRPAYRGLKVGRVLVETLIGVARERGYRALILSTADVQIEAQRLYRSLGFVPTEPYLVLPEAMMAHEIFLKLGLDDRSGG